MTLFGAFLGLLWALLIFYNLAGSPPLPISHWVIFAIAALIAWIGLSSLFRWFRR